MAAIGNFDGIHVGHQAILTRAASLARAWGTQPLALTFDPHPDVVLRRKALPGLLTPLPEKARWLEHYGIPHVVVARFDRTFASLAPERFLNEILGHRLALRGVVVGDDFTFGHRAAGKVTLLREWGAARGMTVETIAPVRQAGERISSSRIRQALVEGAFDQVRAMLGHPYTLTGRVVPGDARGRVLGYPTANLELDPAQLVPAEGVYVAEAEVEGEGAGQALPALAVYSRRPTFGQREAAFEVYLLGFQGDLYARELRVALHRRLRGIVRFAGPEALKAQIQQDFREARGYFGL